VEYIEKEDFIGMLKQYPIIYEKYREKMDRILFNGGSTQELELDCWYCEDYHLYEHCGGTHNWFRDMVPPGNYMIAEVNDVCQRRVFERPTLKCKKSRVSLDFSGNSDRVGVSAVYFPFSNCPI
jgi:hypothetical protein